MIKEFSNKPNMMSILLFLIFGVIFCQIGSLYFENVEIAKLSRETVKSCFFRMFGPSSILTTKEDIEKRSTKYIVSIYRDHHIIVKIVNTKKIDLDASLTKEVSVEIVLTIIRTEYKKPPIDDDTEDIYIFPRSKNYDANGTASITNENFLEIIDFIKSKLNKYTIRENADVYFTFSGSQHDAFFKDSKIEISKKQFEGSSQCNFKANNFPSDLERYLIDKLFKKQNIEDILSFDIKNHKILSFISKGFYDNMYFECEDRMNYFELNLMLELTEKYLYAQTLLDPDRINLCLF